MGLCLLLVLIQGIGLTVGIPVHVPPPATNPITTVGTGTVEYKMPQSTFDYIARDYKYYLGHEQSHPIGSLEYEKPDISEGRTILQEHLLNQGKSEEGQKISCLPNGEVEIKEGNYACTIHPSRPFPKETWSELARGLIEITPFLARVALATLVYACVVPFEPVYFKAKEYFSSMKKAHKE
ncbi:hypothetical protein PGT21_008699 [Puccinia graminis f. sp. tritici]|uniref:Uncharacterized protein n=2 Tax=Puccinia graminis f. sp. tritici TaxID=56615 RepID=H6QU35_PUCGT|nr:uncharacterized protein PGTG_22261 [Puccinia graminis f. sp. tritici CRL 75-36-700-3]EHS64447.1 hypothetical protein PGTG_22261 [Puccinia graminis f. sp. tritici CRL 75-36-700-3]KAA1096232.1 hypothetical protein PGT21_009413 [Puccinia graminis f. sp. tritici]KAA1099107.1 hypothetical protein PGTUg99_019892 [Puccinia graminis f. sp. tritici]KAA1112758.1 hypothetical protein PGT21_008699 [Puccinia graminis f. sp. tritici]